MREVLTQTAGRGARCPSRLERLLPSCCASYLRTWSSERVGWETCEAVGMRLGKLEWRQKTVDGCVG